jgi:hypothetical protein
MRIEPFLAPSSHARRRRFAIAAVITSLALTLGVVPSAVAMRPNFDSPLNLMMGGRSVDAHGPITWEAGETSGTFTITITQGTVSGSATATYTTSSSSWHMTVTASGGARFHDGAATGSGTAVVNLSGGGTETYTWSSPITLN